jgi:hypothetical protein
MRNVYIILVGRHEYKKQLVDIGLELNIILKCIFKE